MQSAGLNNDAVVPVGGEQLEWADVILVMEEVHRNRLNRKFREYLGGKRIVVLGIPDDFAYMDPELIEILRAKCRMYLPG